MNFLRRLRWAWQRVYRGWDDRVIWNLDWYLAKMLPIWLRQLKAQKHGVPMGLDSAGWDAVLDDVIAGFEAAHRICGHDFPAWDELHEEERRRFGRMLVPWDDEDAENVRRLRTELGFWDKLSEQEADATVAFEKGMASFVKHFFSLWD